MRPEPRRSEVVARVSFELRLELSEVIRLIEQQGSTLEKFKYAAAVELGQGKDWLAAEAPRLADRLLDEAWRWTPRSARDARTADHG